jgi:UTP:GlnB (protein PII) uridylyltransferase
MATTTEVRDLLRATTLPQTVVDGMLEDASPIWLMGERADVLAADLALCHPRPMPGEVRAVVRPTTAPATWRITIVSEDRPGLLAVSAGTLTAEGLSITRVAASAWLTGGLAVMSITASASSGADRTVDDWDRLGDRLRVAIAANETPAVEFEPMAPVRVRTMPQRGGRVLVTVRAPDHSGLLWAISHWLATQGCTIDALRAGTAGAMAEGRLLVRGDVDTRALVAYLSGRLPALSATDIALGLTGLGVRLVTGAVRTAVNILRPPRS